MHSRQKSSAQHLTSLCASLSEPAENARFAHLSGVFPSSNAPKQSKEQVEKVCVQFSGADANNGRQVSLTNYSSVEISDLIFSATRMVETDCDEGTEE